MIIADENIEQYWIDLLRDKGYEVLSIREQRPGSSDKEVATIAQSINGILMTEDKDFGELVFAHGIKGLSVIFLRYDQPNYALIEKAVLEVINSYHNSPQNYFITVTERTVRIKSI